MRDNSMLVNSNVNGDELRTHHFKHVIITDQESFEKLGFKIISNDDNLDVTLPEGWTIEEPSDDAFSLDFVDENGVAHASIEFGNYPYRKGCMWLY